MKAKNKWPLLIFFSLILTTTSAQATFHFKLEESADRTVGKKISNDGPITSKTIDEKQVETIQLINEVGALANGLRESEKDDAEYAYSGFIARFQAIRSEREAFSKKEAMADNKTLENYSQRLDRLTADILNFLK